MIDPTEVDVIEILQEYPNNITARRWLKNPAAIKEILSAHTSWNQDHLKIGEHKMVYSLDTHIEIYLDQPETIDQYLSDEKEPPR